ncbi:MAG: hypothetical protein H7833_12735 [Magnetococcus sp. DMHC-1]
MNTADRIYKEVKQIPEEHAQKILDFVLAIKKQTSFEEKVWQGETDGLSSGNCRRDGSVDDQKAHKHWPANLCSIDMRGWRLDREDAHASMDAMARLLANPVSLKEGGTLSGNQRDLKQENPHFVNNTRETTP